MTLPYRCNSYVNQVSSKWISTEQQHKINKQLQKDLDDIKVKNGILNERLSNRSYDDGDEYMKKLD